MCLILSACANKNALLQTPTANTTSAVDQINDTLDEALDEQNEPLSPHANEEVPLAVVDALTPQIGNYNSAIGKIEPRFDIGVNNVPARDFFAGLVDGTNKNMVVHPDVSGSISLQLRDVTVSEVMSIAKDIYGYEYEESGRLIKVFPAGLRTQIFQINYLNVNRNGDSETRVSSGQITQNSSGGSSSSSDSDSDSGSASTQSSGFGTRIATTNQNDFWQRLESTLQLIIGSKEGNSVVITPSTGMAVVRADSDTLASVERYLESSELILQRQVILEAKILEVSLNEGYQQGVDWSFSRASDSLDSSGNPKNGVNFTQLARQVTSGDVGGVFASTIKLGNFDTTINLLGTQGNVQVLSSPRIATVNNQKAVIKVGSDEYFVTDIDFESNSDSNSTSTDIDLTPFFSGIALDVTPQISEDGKIILHVHPTISKVEDQQKIISVGGQDLDLPLAFSSIRESDSIITAENGQIVVIGGLIQNRSSDNNSSVPFLSELPLVGELFKQKGEQSEKTELVILLRPTVTNRRVIRQDIKASRDRFGEFRDVMAAPVQTSFY
ncbi:MULTISPECIES: pilus (MSHA type) biogenesis protein MshL [unclassified Oleiphilus]|uniref:pilus (MSHA type) biogenesis protein MshL n=7 Tax=Oleiphilus TaxID=141450 RepID=UPI0009EF28F7|nr:MULTISPECIES: pilus (MSHA type) biogenesis protein MshL [unclassified Oleiphilus]